MKYRVFFEIYGKKMQTEIEASSEAEAKAQVMGNIKFHKVINITDAKREIIKDIESLDFLKDLFGKK